VKLDTADEVLTFIIEERKSRSVLLYCTPVFKDYLVEQDLSFSWMNPTAVLSDSFL
jgi:hypothetical protein